MDSNIFVFIGHIDHGKTTIIKKMTNINLDSLPEEKKRGITVNLGFTNIKLKNGTASIIDVPGHEKYIKNMIAGLPGVNNFVLVISAKDGIQEQTIEHFNIMRYFKIKNCIIIINKTDLVNDIQLQNLREEVIKMIENTEYENSDIIYNTILNNNGISILKENMNKLINQNKNNDEYRPIVNIDRNFSIKGIGTIITGTYLGKSINLLDSLTVYPKRLKTSIKSLQINNKNIEELKEKSRVAIGLRDINFKDISRGNIVSTIDDFSLTKKILAKISFLNNGTRIKEKDNYILYIGTKELSVTGRILDYKYDIMNKVNVAIIDIRFKEADLIFRNERFILRDKYKKNTIGGGKIIDPIYDYRVKKDIEKDNFYKNNSDLEYIFYKINKYSYKFLNLEKLKNKTNFDNNYLKLILKDLISKKLVFLIEKNYITIDFLKKFEKDVNKKISNINNDTHITIHDFKKQYFRDIPYNIFLALFNKIEINNDIIINNGKISSASKDRKFNANEEKILKIIKNEYTEVNMKPINLRDLFTDKDMIEVDGLLLYLINSNYLTKIGENIYINTDALLKATDTIVEYIIKNEDINISQAKKILKTSRKLAIAILEYLDNKNITKRCENIRCLYN